jgi:Cu-Zn family superoxide dismutase
MRYAMVSVGIGLLLLNAGPSAQNPTGTPGTPIVTASASLIDTQGRAIGGVRLQQTPHGVLLKLDLKNATPGIHGLHVHEVGRCDAPSFESAGGHFDAAGHQHGFLNPRGYHAGDLPNIEVPASTQHSVEHLVANATLEPGPRTLLDADGSSIVMHAGKDDYVADPAGNSGDRLACGRIVRADKP